MSTSICHLMLVPTYHSSQQCPSPPPPAPPLTMTHAFPTRYIRPTLSLIGSRVNLRSQSQKWTSTVGWGKENMTSIIAVENWMQGRLAREGPIFAAYHVRSSQRRVRTIRVSPQAFTATRGVVLDQPGLVAMVLLAPRMCILSR